MSHLPPELAAFAALLDAQPGPVQAAFQYVVAVMLVEAGKARLMSVAPGESGALCSFETVAGDVFSVVRPPLDDAAEAELRAAVRQIWEEEGDADA